MIKAYKPALDQIGLTYTQYITMMVLWEETSINVKQLGGKLHLDSGTLTPLLKRLETAGFVTRKRDRNDERNLIVTLTEAGAALEAKAEEIPDRIRACVRLCPEEVSSLYHLLYQVMDQLSWSEDIETASDEPSKI
ncbi:MAG: MarR family transcriptional regulator, partial [Lawsonibacter sp.]|nr:MarR family transcriptional regulator [Lawsonibacter sp.]